MKLKLTALALILLFSDFAFSQQSFVQTINLDTSITKTLDSASFYVKNPTNKVMQITNGRTLNNMFFLRSTSFTVNPNDSVQKWVIFRTNQNITYRDFIIYDNNVLKNSLVYYTVATGKYADVLYAFTQGLIDEPLKTALKTFTTTGYITLGYNVGRDRMYESIDDYGNNDTLECVYTGRRAYVPNRAGAGNVNFNCEHTWPQSFFNSNDPMVSDVNHLFPTDDEANNRRANYQFGIVVGTPTWQNVSKLGVDFEGQICFEPRDKHKGNVARSLFYFAVKYGNQGGYMSGKQENVLRQWTVLDTVDANEMTRNNRIKQYLNVRNPFIDHPEFIDRIKSTYSTILTIPRPKTSVAPSNAVYDTLAKNDTSSYYISIFNSGEGNATINNVASSNGVFTVESFPTSIAQNSFAYARVKFKPNANNQTFTSVITISTSDTVKTVNLTGYSNSQTAGIISLSSQVPDKFALSQNFPNPFNPATKINFAVPYRSFVTLKVFDMNGREVSSLVNNTLQAGTYQYDFDGSSLTSGTYFYKLETSDFTSTKKLILIK
ncbi:MAG: endonuclease [Ignavibacteria bacterium]|nr:endonuclease [Ignavibacteria bacterium]